MEGCRTAISPRRTELFLLPTCGGGPGWGRRGTAIRPGEPSSSSLPTRGGGPGWGGRGTAISLRDWTGLAEVNGSQLLPPRPRKRPGAGCAPPPAESPSSATSASVVLTRGVFDPRRVGLLGNFRFSCPNAGVYSASRRIGLFGNFRFGRSGAGVFQHPAESANSATSASVVLTQEVLTRRRIGQYAPCSANCSSLRAGGGFGFSISSFGFVSDFGFRAFFPGTSSCKDSITDSSSLSRERTGSGALEAARPSRLTPGGHCYRSSGGRGKHGCFTYHWRAFAENWS